jgi:hypothetical protein
MLVRGVARSALPLRRLLSGAVCTSWLRRRVWSLKRIASYLYRTSGTTLDERDLVAE